MRRRTATVVLLRAWTRALVGCAESVGTLESSEPVTFSNVGTESFWLATRYGDFAAEPVEP